MQELRSQDPIAACESPGNPFLEMAAAIALTHHEKWNGKGYPQRLVKDEIPLAGRIVAISDVYDALTSERSYKPAFSDDKAMGIIRQGVGQHFDPEVHAAFESCFETIAEIRKEFSNTRDEATV